MFVAQITRSDQMCSLRSYIRGVRINCSVVSRGVHPQPTLSAERSSHVACPYSHHRFAPIFCLSCRNTPTTNLYEARTSILSTTRTRYHMIAEPFVCPVSSAVQSPESSPESSPEHDRRVVYTVKVYIQPTAVGTSYILPQCTGPLKCNYLVLSLLLLLLLLCSRWFYTSPK